MGAALLLGLAGCGPTRSGTGEDVRRAGAAQEGTPCDVEGQRQACYTGPAGTEGVAACRAGTQLCQGGVWGPCEGEVTPQAEVCNGADDDCDGTADEPGDLPNTCHTMQLGACAMGTSVCRDGREACIETQGPKPEVCDGLDNDCDGQTDEDFPGKDTACTVEGSSACIPAHPGKLACAGGQVVCSPSTSVPACDTGEQGLCRQGVLVCAGEHTVCAWVRSPGPELCDGMDNNCNGETDEGNPQGNASCQTGLPGACAQGRTQCQAGSLTCEAPLPTDEVCDGIDNDCDGEMDEGFVGNACSTNQPGVCAAGRTVCTASGMACEPTTPASPETCDGQDNDCDGASDENNPEAGGSCATGQQGTCARGTMQCQGGGLTCVAPPPTAEVCDGLDNDCDGSVDDGNPEGGAECTTITCRGQRVCVSGSLICVCDGRP